MNNRNKRVVISKTIRIPANLDKKLMDHLYNSGYDGVPHGEQSKFFERAIINELERYGGKNLNLAHDSILKLYGDLIQAPRVNQNQLAILSGAIEVIKELKKEQDNATFK